MRTYYKISNEITALVSGLVAPSNEGLEITYTKDLIDLGIPNEDLTKLQDLGYSAKMTGRKWLVINVTLEVVRKENLSVWYK